MRTYELPPAKRGRRNPHAALFWRHLPVSIGRLKPPSGRPENTSGSSTASGAECEPRHIIAYQQYADEVDRLNLERGQLERDLGGADEAYQKALNDAEAALDGMLDWGEAMKNPFTSTRGQGTESYEQWRVPLLWSVLMLNDPHHPEWERATQWLDTLCAVSGHRPDFSKADADKARRYWDNFRDEHQPAESTPGMGDVIAELHAPFVDRALHVEADATPPRIEDHRPRAELKIPWRLHGGNT